MLSDGTKSVNGWIIFEIDRATTEEEAEQPFASVFIGHRGVVEALKHFEADRISVRSLAEIEILRTSQLLEFLGDKGAGLFIASLQRRIIERSNDSPVHRDFKDMHNV